MFAKSAVNITVCLISSFLVFCAKAETLTVTSDADSGDGTLRALVGSAADGDVIAIPEGMMVNVDSKINLPSKGSIKVVGLGSGATIRGTRQAQLFSYSSGTYELRFEFENLTMSDFSSLQVVQTNASTKAVTTNYNNGAVFNIATRAGYETVLVCNDCRFTGNRTRNTSAGAVFYHAFGSKTTVPSEVPFSLYCTNCVFSGNAGGSAIAGSIGNYTHFANKSVFSHCDFHGNGLAALDEDELGEPAYKYGLFNGPSSMMLFDGCVFTNNAFAGAQNVGAIYRNQVLNPAVTLAMVDCTVADNAYDVELFNSQAGSNTFTRCKFIRNVVSGLENAGNVMGTWTSNTGAPMHVRFEDSLFEDNENNSPIPGSKFSYLFGGLFYIGYSSEDASMVFERCAFRRNSAKNIRTSLVTVYTDKPFPLTFSGCAFEDNASGGGQLMVLKGNSEVHQCSFIGNTRVPAASAGIDWSDVVMIPMVRGGFYDCTFYGNVQDGNRGVIDAGTLVIRNCTLVNNRTKASYGAIASVKSVADIRNTICNGNFSVNGETVASLDVGLGGVKGDPIPENVRCVAASKGTWQDASLSAWNNDENLIGKSNEELGLVLPPAANGSKIKLLDGTSPLTIAITETSPLRKAGKVFADYPLPFDGRGITRDASAPCIGAYEYAVTAAAAGLMLLFH